MNYYDARQLEDKSGWHYTSLNRRSGTHPVGYCSRFQPCSECGDFGKPECEVCGGKGYVFVAESHVHATPEEARACFRQYLLDGQREESYADWTGCVVCDAPTKRGLTTRPPIGVGHPLCDAHRTAGQLEALTPVPGQIIASY